MVLKEHADELGENDLVSEYQRPRSYASMLAADIFHTLNIGTEFIICEIMLSWSYYLPLWADCFYVYLVWLLIKLPKNYFMLMLILVTGKLML